MAREDYIKWQARLADQRELQNKALNALNKRRPYDYNGHLCWSDPSIPGAPQPFSPRNILLTYNIALDEKTGKYVVVTDDEKQRMTREREQQDAAIARREANNACKSGDATVWVDVTGKARYNTVMAKDLKDHPQTLARLMLLACYTKYNDHILVNGRGCSTQMTQKTMRKILGLNAKVFGDFFSEATEKGYIRGSDDNGYELYLPTWYGQLKKAPNAYKSRIMQQLHTDQYMRLYNMGGKVERDENGKIVWNRLTAKDHRYVGKILQLIPYVHLDTNRLCYDPICGEDNIDDITTAQLGKIIGSDLKHRKRDIEKICSITVPVADDQGRISQQYLLLCVVAGGGSARRTYYVLNPAVLYHGEPDQRKAVAVMHPFFCADSNGEIF